MLRSYFIVVHFYNAEDRLSVEFAEFAESVASAESTL